MSLRTGETAKERQEYAKTGEKPAALIRKELLQEARALEAREAELKAQQDASFQKIQDYADNVTGPLIRGKAALLQEYGEAAKEMSEYQELDRRYQEAKVGRNALWDENTAINRERIEIKRNMQKLARGSLLSDTPADVNLNFGKLRRASRPPVQEGRQIFSDLVENRPSIDGKTLHVRRPTYYGKHRAYYQHGAADRPAAIHMPVKTSARTTVHEMGHWLEDMDPNVHRKAIEFLSRRTTGQTPVKLKDYWNSIKPGYGDSYEDHEVGIKDNFMDIYMGKMYGGRASEIVSMGLEYLAFNSVEFARQDPDYFDLMVDIARGL